MPRTYVISDFNDEENVGTFYEKKLQKTNQEEFRVEKAIKKKGNANKRYPMQTLWWFL